MTFELICMWPCVLLTCPSMEQGIFVACFVAFVHKVTLSPIGQSHSGHVIAMNRVWLGVYRLRCMPALRSLLFQGCSCLIRIALLSTTASALSFPCALQMSGDLGTARRSARRKIQDTGALSSFVQTLEHSQQRSAADSPRPSRPVRNSNSDAGAMAAQPVDHAKDALPRPQSTPALCMGRADSGAERPGMLRSASQQILEQGGMRVLPEMLVFLNKDDQIILADVESGMAALVTGVTKVGDAELATIAGARSARWLQCLLGSAAICGTCLTAAKHHSCL